MSDRFEGFRDNWEYEHCVKPEDIDWAIEEIERLREENEQLKRKETNQVMNNLSGKDFGRLF